MNKEKQHKSQREKGGKTQKRKERRKGMNFLGKVNKERDFRFYYKTFAETKKEEK